MDRLLNRLERRWGRHSVEGLTYVLVVAQAAVFLLSYTKPGFIELLLLDPAQVRAGQVWRLVTYLFVPRSLNPLWVFFELSLFYSMGTALEHEWEPFRYQLFWLVGVLLTSGFAFGFGVPTDNTHLLLSLFLAFATLWPDYEIRLFFILPIAVKWLALLSAAALLLELWNAYGWAKLFPVLGVGNYLLFLGPELVSRLRGRAAIARRRAEKSVFAPSSDSVVPKVRRCAICGITSTDDPDMDFRVCSCEKHGGKPTELCITHARNH